MDADLLEDFVELTGSTMAEAMKYMKLCDDDLNAAVGCYFDPAVVSWLQFFLNLIDNLVMNPLTLS